MRTSLDSFCVIIIAHGRPEMADTYNLLHDCGYHGRIIFLVDNEDKKVQGYFDRYGKNNVFMFDKLSVAKKCDPMNNFGGRKAALFARNIAFNVAKELGYTYFCVLDDDYYYFGHRGEFGARKTKKIDEVFDYFVTFLRNTPTVKAIAFSQGGDHIGGYKGNILVKRKCMNSWFCCSDRPFSFYGVMNDDVNAYLRNGYLGDVFLTYMPFQLDQADTQKGGGGMVEAYVNSGTYVKSFYSVMLVPSAVKIKLMGVNHTRLHHSIAWRNVTPCIINEKYKKRNNGI